MNIADIVKFSPVDIEERKKWDFRPGDKIKVWYKIKEGDKTRSQILDGIVIARKHGFEPGATFTVRKIREGVGVEHTFPVYSPNIEKIELAQKGKARRAKLYYIRKKTAKEIQKKMRQMETEKAEIIVEQKEAKKE